jgi:hypothetical protein
LFLSCCSSEALRWPPTAFSSTTSFTTRLAHN